MDYWNYHDNKMRELKQLYNKTSKQTQNKLQELLDTFAFTSENLYNIADTQTKKRINTYIDSWKEEELFTGYFKTLCNNIYNKARVKNSEILELLIYSAYMEEQIKLQDSELSILYNDANYYYSQGQQEVIKATKSKKEPSILEEALFLYLMQQANYSGFTFNQYIQATIQYNTQQIYKQAVIDIMQDKELKINSDEFKRLFNQQNNQKLCINDGKISGSVDMQMIGLNNQAKIEGIKKLSEEDSKVKFIAVTDENSTDMCQSMNGKEFYINKENVFDRYWGETKSELRLMRVKCKGLVLGVCLPPISHHFHYCRSYIMYLPTIEKEVETEYNNFSTFLRSKNYKYDGFEDDYITAATEYQQIPENVRRALEEKGLEVEFDYQGKNSGYDRKNNKILLKRGIPEGEMYHELGHAIYYNFNVGNMKEYKNIVQDIFNNATDKIPKIITDRTENFYTIDTNYGNLDDFQLYLGSVNNINYVLANIQNKNLPELFSESYRKHYLKEKQLKSLDELIERIEKDVK